MYGVFKFINQGNENTKSVEKIQGQLEEIKTSQQFPMVRFDSLEQAVSAVQRTVSKTDRKVDVLTKQFTNHLSKDKSVTKEELMQIIQEQQQKKVNWYDTIDFKIKINKK
jgi:predicted  nucleic acid-binding Zn-ribbon protein